ncbi:MAG: hypothetical protein ACLPQ0_09380 [Candidatus Binatus sp.]
MKVVNRGRIAFERRDRSRVGNYKITSNEFATRKYQVMGVEELSYRRSQVCNQQDARIKCHALDSEPGRIAKPTGDPVRKTQASVRGRDGRRYRGGFPGDIDFRAIVHRQPVRDFL